MNVIYLNSFYNIATFLSRPQLQMYPPVTLNQ